ncbi:hypothetical protein [Mycobacterium haemophilum]|uniref:hypothetical protein n=1 Tax=Mycobacterium haemophilum TaxID=29311 RepID=UPI0018CF418C|nr:hypothetical protein [Mycobacterium haemophilum]
MLNVFPLFQVLPLFQLLVGGRRWIDMPLLVTEVIHRLSDYVGAGQCHHLVVSQELRRRIRFDLAANKTGRVAWKVRDNHVR